MFVFCYSSNDWDFISTSLVSLAFCLMDVSSNSSSSTSSRSETKTPKVSGPIEKSYNIGFRLLVIIFKDHQNSRKFIIEQVYYIFSGFFISSYVLSF